MKNRLRHLFKWMSSTIQPWSDPTTSPTACAVLPTNWAEAIAYLTALTVGLGFLPLTSAKGQTVTVFASGSNFTQPTGLVFDANSNLYVANDNFPSNILKITSGGTISVFVNGTTSPSLGGPVGLGFDNGGNLYIANRFNNAGAAVLKVTSVGSRSTLASIQNSVQPQGLAVDVNSNVYVADAYFPNSIRKITSAGAQSIFVDGTIPVNGSTLDSPYGLSFDASGNLYVADQNRNRILKVTSAGSISVFATGVTKPKGLAFDASGNLYVANSTANTISKISSGGTVSTFLTGAQVNTSTGASLNGPSGLAVSNGSLYISDQGNNRILKVALAAPASLIGFAGTPTPVCVGRPVTFTATVAGVTGTTSYTVDNGVGSSVTGSTSTSVISQSVTASGIGAQTFTLTASNAGTVLSQTANITVNALPTNASLTSGTLTCATTSVTLTASATGGSSYTLNGGPASQTNTTGSFVVSTAGNYTAIIANASGCTATATATVMSNTAVPTNASLTSGTLTCAATSAILTASATNGTSYTLNGGTTSQSNTTGQFVVSTPGTYTVVISGANGCTTTATATVTATPGSVTNTTTGATFCTIQSAVDAASAGHTINVAAGTYNEQVLINKGLTINGQGAGSIVNFTGTVTGKPTLFDISADGVVIQNLHFNVDLSKLRSAIIASAAGIDNIGVINNIVDAYGTPAGTYGERNAVSINYAENRVATGGVNSITATGNTINGTGTSFFRSGFSVDEAGGTFSGNTIQSINQDIQVRFGSNGAIIITNNMINGGGVELAEMNAGAGPITVMGNTFNGTFGSGFTSALRLKNNTNAIPTTVSGNTFTGHNQGVSLENYQAVAVNNNTFTPATGSTTYRHVTVDTKEFSSSSGAVAPAVSLTLLGNTFTGSSATTSGTALVFANRDNDNPTFGPFVVGTMGQENTFAASLGTFIALDGSTGTVAPNATQAAPFAIDINIGDNKFDVGAGLQLPENLSAADQTALETKLLHKPDNAALGRLLYVCATPTITASATAVCAGSSVTLTASGAASYTWSTGETTASILVMPTSTTTVSVTATTANGCVSATAVTITVNDAPTNASLTSGTLTCAVTSATLTASATGGASYTLLGGPSSQSNTTGQFVVSMAGTYTAVIANASGCTATATATVTSSTAAPTATLTGSTNPVCAPNSVTITAGGTGTSFTFSAGATQIGTSSQAIVTQSGTYSVTVSNASGCTATASTSVTVNTPPAAPTLTGVSRTFNANTTPLPLAQFVSAPGVLSFSGVSGAIANPATANISTAGVQNFSVTQTDGNGCVSGATPFSITVLPPTPGNQSVCRSSQVVLQAITTGVRYEWYKNGTSAPFKLTEIASIQKGTATSSLTVVSIQTTASYYCKVFQANGSFTFDGPLKVTVDYSCIAPGARLAATEVMEVPLSVVLTPNPVVDGQLRAVVRGASGVSLSVELVDLKGQLIRSQKWQAANAEQVIEWNMGNGPSGLYLLRAQTPGESTTVKVIKQ